MAKLTLKPKSPEFHSQKVHTKIVFEKKDIIDLIIKQRKKLGLSQMDLANFSNLARQSISDIERGKVDPQLSNILGMLRLCGIKVVLEYEEGEKNGKN